MKWHVTAAVIVGIALTAFISLVNSQGVVTSGQMGRFALLVLVGGFAVWGRAWARGLLAAFWGFQACFLGFLAVTGGGPLAVWLSVLGLAVPAVVLAKNAWEPASPPDGTSSDSPPF